MKEGMAVEYICSLNALLRFSFLFIQHILTPSKNWNRDTKKGNGNVEDALEPILCLLVVVLQYYYRTFKKDKDTK